MAANLSRKRGMPAIPNFTPGQTIALGMTAVAATFGGFYMMLRKNQAKKDASGTNPYYEYLMRRVARSDATLVPISTVEARKTKLPAPVKEHHSQHETIAEHKSSPEYVSGMWAQPTPQRARQVGSEIPYTKSPDYSKSYEKTSS
ncbi:hypothetical protein Hypma_013962 [Hypsizygus marmoreus]|uniref:Uncharacterized protein n=1 Tax=Hypsizygus marmoreus TaxID=39966 RepID=A0A369KAH6_HYPMA|nr:hypothetical protein Hypma_013962 [Hypsizygus marmoreus]